ncbi:MAG: PAS domain S-box protein [Candidatus Melainabacteria bacterium]|nr:MAG: PAS domain S-box protein [Candidatus Melainabacteria bacterium]
MEELSQPSKVKSSGGRPIVDVTETGDGELLAVTRGDSDGERLEAVPQSSSLFKFFFDDCAAPCFVKDDQGCYVFINEEFERQFGVRRCDLIGRNASSWLGEEFFKKIRLRDHEVLTNQCASSEQEEITDADGVTKTWHVHRFPIFDSRRRCFLGGIAFDITAEKQKQEQMREKSELLELILNNIGDPVIAVDQSGALLLFNPAAIKLHGLDNARGKYGLFMPDKVTRYAQEELPLARAIKGEEVRDLELFVRTPYHNEGITVSASAQPLRDKDGKLRGGAAVLRDITPRKQVEEALLAARDEALAASELKSQFVSNISHELRTPMSGVLGMTELLLEMGLEPEQKELAVYIYESAQNLLKVVNELLDFSRLEAGKLYLEKAEVDIHDLVQASLQSISASAEQKRIALVSRIDENIPRKMMGDKLRIQQVLNNITANAIKFTEKGKINVSVTEARQFAGGMIVRFTVSDTGIGIEKAQQETLFQPFVQVDGSNTRKYGGVGLGLSICRRLIKLMSGDIGVSSVIGKGSDFWFEVPMEVLAKANHEQ